MKHIPYSDLIQQVVDAYAFEIHEAAHNPSSWYNDTFLNTMEKIKGPRIIDRKPNNTRVITVTTPLGDVFQYDLITFEKKINGKIVYHERRI